MITLWLQLFSGLSDLYVRQNNQVIGIILFLVFHLKMLFLLSPHMESFSGFSSRCLQMSFPWSELQISISWNSKDRVIFICCWVTSSSSIFLQRRALFAWLEYFLQFSFFLKHHILFLFFRNTLPLFCLKIDINVMPPFPLLSRAFSAFTNFSNS